MFMKDSTVPLLFCVQHQIMQMSLVRKNTGSISFFFFSFFLLANENHTQILLQAGRCAVETEDEPRAVSDTLLLNLEGLPGRRLDQNSALDATCSME